MSLATCASFRGSLGLLCISSGPWAAFPDFGGTDADFPYRQKSVRSVRGCQCFLGWRLGGTFAVVTAGVSVEPHALEVGNGGIARPAGLAGGGWSPGVRRPHPIRCCCSSGGVSITLRGEGVGLQALGVSALLLEADPLVIAGLGFSSSWRLCESRLLVASDRN